MFNVCPGCGAYSDAKVVMHAAGKAVCPECNHEQTYLSLPLFVVTGASGSGKTTAAIELLKHTHDFIVLDQDILWSEAFNEPANDYQLFRNTWLRMAKNLHQSGKSVVLFGSAVPKQFESCVERRYIGTIYYLALVCQAKELEHRLVERPNWRRSATPENLRSMLDFNQWLWDNAAKTEPKMSVLETTSITVSETAQKILRWIKLEAIR
jgi:adenylate kinase family enzyme